MSSSSLSKTKLSRQLYASLGILEISMCTAAWMLGVGYSIFRVYKASSRYFYKLVMSELEPGWFSSERNLKDTSDMEWAVFADMIVSSIPWFILHFIGSQFLKKRSQFTTLNVFNILLCFIYLFKTVKVISLLYLLIQPLTFFLCVQARSTKLIWALGLLYITVFPWWLPLKDFASLFGADVPTISTYVNSVLMCWINARCVSYSLDVIWKHVETSKSGVKEFLRFMAYVLYFPLFTNGPILLYKAFLDGIESPYVPWDLSRAQRLLFLLMRYGFWLLFNHFILHFFYFSAIQFDMDIMAKLDLWTLCGVGYSMGQFFHLKYVVFYGVSRPFLMADGIEALPHPKCIGRIHLYSDMWRYFDHGLYLFLHKYIYAPLLGEKRDFMSKMVATVLNFAYIYLWHGIFEQVFIWSFLNFLGIVFESCARTVAKYESYQKWEKSNMSPQCRRRFHALLSSPLFAVSIISNFYFFMGKTVGDLFFYRCFTSWPIGTPLVLLFAYCGSQTSIEAKNWEIRRELFKK